MKVRPRLSVGDIVKLSKKGKKCQREFSSNSTLVVSGIEGDGIDRASVITCRVELPNENKYYKFYRSELWTTGKNAFVVNRVPCTKEDTGNCIICNCINNINNH